MKVTQEMVDAFMAAPYTDAKITDEQVGIGLQAVLDLIDREHPPGWKDFVDAAKTYYLRAGGPGEVDAHNELIDAGNALREEGLL